METNFNENSLLAAYYVLKIADCLRVPSRIICRKKMDYMKSDPSFNDYVYPLGTVVQVKGFQNFYKIRKFNFHNSVFDTATYDLEILRPYNKTEEFQKNVSISDVMAVPEKSIEYKSSQQFFNSYGSAFAFNVLHFALSYCAQKILNFSDDNFIGKKYKSLIQDLMKASMTIMFDPNESVENRIHQICNGIFEYFNSQPVDIDMVSFQAIRQSILSKGYREPDTNMPALAFNLQNFNAYVNNYMFQQLPLLPALFMFKYTDEAKTKLIIILEEVCNYFNLPHDKLLTCIHVTTNLVNNPVTDNFLKTVTGLNEEQILAYHRGLQLLESEKNINVTGLTSSELIQNKVNISSSLQTAMVAGSKKLTRRQKKQLRKTLKRSGLKTEKGGMVSFVLLMGIALLLINLLENCEMVRAVGEDNEQCARNPGLFICLSTATCGVAFPNNQMCSVITDAIKNLKTQEKITSIEEKENKLKPLFSENQNRNLLEFYKSFENNKNTNDFVSSILTDDIEGFEFQPNDPIVKNIKFLLFYDIVNNSDKLSTTNYFSNDVTTIREKFENLLTKTDVPSLNPTSSPTQGPQGSDNSTSSPTLSPTQGPQGSDNSTSSPTLSPTQGPQGSDNPTKAPTHEELLLIIANKPDFFELENIDFKNYNSLDTDNEEIKKNKQEVRNALNKKFEQSLSKILEIKSKLQNQNGEKKFLEVLNLEGTPNIEDIRNANNELQQKYDDLVKKPLPDWIDEKDKLQLKTNIQEIKAAFNNAANNLVLGKLQKDLAIIAKQPLFFKLDFQNINFKDFTEMKGDNDEIKEEKKKIRTALNYKFNNSLDMLDDEYTNFKQRNDYKNYKNVLNIKRTDIATVVNAEKNKLSEYDNMMEMQRNLPDWINNKDSLQEKINKLKPQVRFAARNLLPVRFVEEEIRHLFSNEIKKSADTLENMLRKLTIWKSVYDKEFYKTQDFNIQDKAKTIIQNATAKIEEVQRNSNVDILNEKDADNIFFVSVNDQLDDLQNVENIDINDVKQKNELHDLSIKVKKMLGILPEDTNWDYVQDFLNSYSTTQKAIASILILLSFAGSIYLYTKRTRRIVVEEPQTRIGLTETNKPVTRHDLLGQNY